MKPSIALFALVACASPTTVTDDEAATYEDDGKADGIRIVKKRRSMTAVKCPAGETKSKIAFFDADSTLARRARLVRRGDRSACRGSTRASRTS